MEAYEAVWNILHEKQRSKKVPLLEEKKKEKKCRKGERVSNSHTIATDSLSRSP
jgi:hypothetical protein